ncbi:TY-Chap domain-containing protein [Couchioplanes caeruleus]|uniref:TY-Chap N-terminal domain-containing protein n=1 Tax=Couchioplanes caeruleus subsp. caeruleus TaxID=56427 RepID=A0A1K0GRE4_9ACTN|nr:hypothetical protein [Couchioplanes caeruleus]OJF14974.1 hypothetical protein BG844_06980 [Couchioplanes caeruleus subsp. caeruleus]
MTNPELWEQLAEELATEMLFMANGDTVILSDGDRFVQFKQGSDRLDAEAVSNRWLPSDQRLSADDEERLEALGWRHPEPSLGLDNWRHSEEWPLRTAAARSLAQRLVSTLRDVMKVDDPRVLEARRFNVFTAHP